jgi:predicted nucleotidyltransferase
MSIELDAIAFQQKGEQLAPPPRDLRTLGILLRGIPKMNRRQQLQDTLERILTALKAGYHPEQVIVFGSLASGLITDTSDLDLLILKKTSKGFFERVKNESLQSVSGNYDVIRNA